MRNGWCRGAHDHMNEMEAINHPFDIQQEERSGAVAAVREE